MPLILHGSKDRMAVQQGGITTGKDRNGRQVPTGQRCCRPLCRRLEPDLTVSGRLTDQSAQEAHLNCTACALTHTVLARGAAVAEAPGKRQPVE